MTVFRLTALCAVEPGDGYFILRIEFRWIGKRPEQFVAFDKLIIYLIEKTTELADQVGRIIENVADHLHLIFTEIAVDMRITDKGVLCLRKFTVRGDAQALALDTELSRLRKPVYI